MARTGVKKATLESDLVALLRKKYPNAGDEELFGHFEKALAEALEELALSTPPPNPDHSE